MIMEIMPSTLAIIIPTAETAMPIMTPMLRPSSSTVAAVVVGAGSDSSGSGSPSASGVEVGLAAAVAAFFAVAVESETPH